MLLRILLFLFLAAVAAGLAWYLQRRRPDPPSAPSYSAPSQLDRSEFKRPDAEVLIVVFSSNSCDTCPQVWQIVEDFEASDVATDQVDVQSNSDIHKRYRIDGVPTTVIADSEGVVVQAFFGFLRNEDIAESVERAR